MGPQHRPKAMKLRESYNLISKFKSTLLLGYPKIDWTRHYLSLLLMYDVLKYFYIQIHTCNILQSMNINIIYLKLTNCVLRNSSNILNAVS